MKTMVKTTFFLSLLSLTQPAIAVDWSPAPLACSPDRAERWNDTSDRGPCHCPPQDRCPPKIELNIEEIEFHIDINFAFAPDHSVIIPANSIDAFKNGDIPLENILSLSVGQLKSYLINSPDKGRLYYHKDLKRFEHYYTIKITTIFKNKDQTLDDWSNNILQLPQILLNTCCDSVCPAGLTPKFNDIEVEKPKQPTALNSDDSDLTSLSAQLGYFTESIQTYTNQEANAGCSEDAESSNPCSNANAPLPNDLKALQETASAVANELNNYVADSASENALSSLDNILKLYDNVYKQVDTFPANFEADFAEMSDIISALSTDVSAKKAIQDADTEYKIVTTIQCEAVDVKSFPREGCLVKGTPIKMADGTTKAIEDLKVGEEIKGNHGAAKIIALSRFTQQQDRMFSINGDKAFFTVEHPVLTPKGWKSVDSLITSVKSDAKIIGTLRVGDIILLEDGKQLPVTSIEEKLIDGGVDAYNISVDGDGSFIANGFIMKGFKKMQMHY